jgi:hypothetical protein
MSFSFLEEGLSIRQFFATGQFQPPRRKKRSEPEAEAKRRASLTLQARTQFSWKEG